RKAALSDQIVLSRDQRHINKGKRTSTVCCPTEPQMAAQLYKTESGRLFHAGAIAIITVGLPARGKTHISRSLYRYLRWLGVQTKVFSVGNYRRQKLGSRSNSFFAPGNLSTAPQRVAIAEECLKDMIKWLDGGGQVGIYDASNTTEERRRWLQDILSQKNIQVDYFFELLEVEDGEESICDKSEIIEANIRSVKISSPDYIGWDPEEAIKDFKGRIDAHQPYYQTITDVRLSFLKLMNVGERLIVNNVHGYLQSRIVYYLMNLHISPRTIYFARNGESLNETYRADAELSEQGHCYAKNLKNYLLSYRERSRIVNPEEQARPLTVWTSARKRCFQTAMHFAEENVMIRQQSVLTEINPGICDGLTPEQIKVCNGCVIVIVGNCNYYTLHWYKAKFPEECQRSLSDPYRYRFPRAESYHDLAIRIEACILELEREKNDVLIIAHESVLRCLYAYLFDRPESEIPRIAIPQHYLIEIVPSAYGCKETRMEILDVDENGGVLEERVVDEEDEFL
ncbi:6-phosphofructo-2-kinase-domain-containing protein, partial [Endogone sp. FLAS-F59071]